MWDITKWYDGDLKKRLLLCMRYAENILNPEAGNTPYFAYTLMRHIVTGGQGEIRVNLLFSTDTPLAYVSSGLPIEGEVEIIPKHSGTLYIRIPENSGKDREGISLTIDGNTADYEIADGYVKCGVRRFDAVRLAFTPQFTEYKETIVQTEYTVTKFGEQVIDINPKTGLYPLHHRHDWETVCK